MMKLMGNAVVGQSGGPTAAINATLAGVIRGVRDYGAGTVGTLYGMKNGIEGFLEGRLVDLGARFAREEDLILLENTPSAALGSCRKKLPDPAADPAFFEALIETFRRYDIRYFFYIGGNDSMDTVAKLRAYTKACDYEMRVIGVPKTIDNDLMGTDHTPGFGSAAKYVATTMQEILCDCAVYTIPAVTIVEVMGRDAGWLTASAALPGLNGRGPDYVYLPERAFDMERFFEDVRTALARHPNVVIAVSEGVRFADGRYVGESTQMGALDAFGHKILAGVGKALEMAVKAELGCKVRSVELNLPQRCASHLASRTDLDESVAAGREGVRIALEGLSGQMIRFARREGEPYACEIGHADVAAIANQVRRVDDVFINERGNHVTDACLSYLRPLILGEVAHTYENGLPQYITIE